LTRDGPFRGAVAVVTGAASGIGRELCRQLAEAGATVAAADRAPGREQVAAQIRSAGGRAEAAAVDVAAKSSIAELLAGVEARHGRLDYMLNNAGMGLVGEEAGISDQQWRRILDTNLMGVVHGSRLAAERMRRQGSGHIVNVASLAGLVPMPAMAAYTATKHAVVGYTLSLRDELRRFGVAVTLACPAYVRTPMLLEPETAGLDPRALAAVARTYPLISPARAARAILSGVRRNRAMVVFPGPARALWLSWRLLRPLHAWLTARYYRRWLATVHTRDGM